MRRRRWGESGLFRGCCLGLVVLAVLIAAGGYVVVRALSRPDLGAAPAGTRHGGTPEAVATALAAEAAAGLAGHPHVVVVLSERDLTVIARARNPLPSRFADPEARSRDGLVVISASGSAGPLGVTTVARLRVTLGRAAGGRPQVETGVSSVEIGRLTVPDWTRSSLDPRGADALALDSEFDASPALAQLRDNLDCLEVSGDGVRVGIHRPGLSSLPSGCG